MRRQLLPALRLFLVFTVILGLGYPLVVLGIGQVAFKDKANGSLVEANGKQVGSLLIGQSFSSDKYFAGRPSAAGNAASGTVTDGRPADPNDQTAVASSGSNLGPTNDTLLTSVQHRADDYRKANGLDAGAPVPVDAVTASGSGLDPHISVENARLQAPRVANARKLSVDQVDKLIDANTEGSSLGFLGLPGVNVLRLNLALDGVSS